MTHGTPNAGRGESRRAFLKKTATATAAVASVTSTASFLAPDVYGRAKGLSVALVFDAHDAVVKQPAVQWAIEQLRESINRRGLGTRICESLKEAAADDECILAASRASHLAGELLENAGVSVPNVPEALGLARGKVSGRKVLLACGSDVRGLVYALLELADRVGFAAEPLAELRSLKRIIQKPANSIRSVARLFASDVEDKGWFNDHSFWQHYLTELAMQRFNRFSLTLGLGYDFPTDIRDAYFHFAYPFLISIPGYNVRATPLPDDERERNLEMLRFISQETARRGLHFQLGLWTHAYKWVDSPNANYVIEGLGAETHGPYCRDALTALLKACPAISGVTFRIHGESGIAEGSYEFWKTVFEGVARCGRQVEIDMHAKGMDEKMIELALATGMPLNISPKFWAEHMGLGYMQGAIRPLEMPPTENMDRGFFAKSSGSRRFLRYGYGDLLTENRRYGVLHRIWPGTQRVLLGSDPELAADYGRASSFCGSLGVEWCEPLSFKGRKGSGLPGDRNAYADESLRPARDFEKFLQSYRVWGRRIYDPDSRPDEWRRFLRHWFGAGALPVEAAVSQASRILPLLTTAHCPSAANNNYWPEMYTNMPIVDARRSHPYGDTLAPKRFGAVSSLDPELFSRIDDFAGHLLRDEASAKYSPAWVAAALESHAVEAKTALTTAKAGVRDSQSPEFRRLAADVAIQCGLGHFFAWKFRAAILFALYEGSKYRAALEQALEAYGKARAAWAEFAEDAKSVYRSDVTFGPSNFQRGHWLDRLAAIDADIADMEKLLRNPAESGTAAPQTEHKLVDTAMKAVLRQGPELRTPASRDFHLPGRSFRRGEPLLIQASLRGTRGVGKLKSLHLRFRHVNQAETWQTEEMEIREGTYRAVIAATYTDSPFPLQYHFELRERAGAAWLFPGLKPGWEGQPYFVVRQT